MTLIQKMEADILLYKWNHCPDGISWRVNRPSRSDGYYTGIVDWGFGCDYVHALTYDDCVRKIQVRIVEQRAKLAELRR